ncbi:MAG: Rieske (2Fe-2S) protein [Planctomycetia bacterium]|nr:Rieske (2Fe-2S) protein [Planctomycetia bacterium]
MTDPPEPLDEAVWFRAASVDECPPGTSVERIVAGRVVALANVAGTWHALDGLCPHQGGPLGTGHLCGTILTCPWHGWQFDVVTGRHKLSATVRQPVYDVQEREGGVYVRVNAAGPASGAEGA